MDVDRLVWEGQVGIAIAFAMPWAIKRGPLGRAPAVAPVAP